MDNASPYGANQRHPSMTQQSNGVGVRLYAGMTGGRRLFEVPSPIFIILVHQKWSDFSTILALMALF